MTQNLYFTFWRRVTVCCAHGWLTMEFLFHLIISCTRVSPVVAAHSPYYDLVCPLGQKNPTKYRSGILGFRGKGTLYSVEDSTLWLMKLIIFSIHLLGCSQDIAVPCTSTICWGFCTVFSSTRWRDVRQWTENGGYQGKLDFWIIIL